MDLCVYFLHQVREVSSYYFFKYDLNPLLSLSFWYFYDVDVVMFDVVPEVP